MSKIDEIRAEMVKAMKNKDKDRKETLSMLLAALKNKACCPTMQPACACRERTAWIWLPQTAPISLTSVRPVWLFFPSSHRRK